MSAPLISILIPSYNAAPYLPELCASIQAQTYKNFEVLILDDASTDATRDAVTPFLQDSRFRFMDWKPNRGVNRATSALLSQMNGEFWCNPGADDVLRPEFIAARLECFQLHPYAVMAHGPSEDIDVDGRTMEKRFRQLDLPTVTEGRRAFTMMLEHNYISTTGVLVRSAPTKLVAPFFLCDWKYAQDWYLWLTILATGFDIVWDTRCLHKYRVHASSLSFTPEKAAIRLAEFRLIPLCALSTAATYSHFAAELWAKWRKTLYHCWLIRAAALWSRGQLQKKWLILGANAFYGRTGGERSLFGELCKHAFGLPGTRLKDDKALREQSFKVSGIAQIRDPVFR